MRFGFAVLMALVCAAVLTVCVDASGIDGSAPVTITCNHNGAFSPVSLGDTVVFSASGSTLDGECQLVSTAPFTMSGVFEYVGSGGRTSSSCVEPVSYDRSAQTCAGQHLGEWEVTWCTFGSCVIDPIGSGGLACISIPETGTCDPWSVSVLQRWDLYSDSHDRTSRWTTMRFLNKDSNYYDTSAVYTVTFGLPWETSCADDGGHELLYMGPVTLTVGETWAMTTTTSLDNVAVRYIISRTSNVAPSYMNGTAYLNGYYQQFNEYTVPMSVTVPARYGVAGPDLYLRVDNTGTHVDSDFSILSACVLPAEASPYCENGIEVLSAPVVLSTGLGEYEELDVNTPWESVVATTWVSGTWPSIYIHLNDDQWALNFDDSGTLSATVPPAGGVFSPVDVRILNASGVNDVSLLSVCLEEAVIAPTSCNLVNHDFITSTVGWDDSDVTWTGSEGNGSAVLEPTVFSWLSQNMSGGLVGSYRVSARMHSSTTVSNTVSVILQNIVDNSYYEGYSYTVGTDWVVVSRDYFLQYPDKITLTSEDDNLIVDWICVEDVGGGGGWRPPIRKCEFPTFDDHPDFSILNLLKADPGENWFWWLAVKIGDLAEWVVCMLGQVNDVALYALIELIDEGVISALPDDITLGSLLRWFRETISAYMAWWLDGMISIILSGQTLGEWLRDQLITLAEWLWHDISLDLIEWFFDQAVAAGLIGEDAANRILWMFRNVDVWINAVMDEARYEFQSAILLFQETFTVFAVLLDGMSTGLMGEDELAMGEALGGFAAYLWRGVEFINDVVAGTPLSALNVVALGIITWGLITWTIGRFGKMLEYLV